MSNKQKRKRSPGDEELREIQPLEGVGLVQIRQMPTRCTVALEEHPDGVRVVLYTASPAGCHATVMDPTGAKAIGELLAKTAEDGIEKQALLVAEMEKAARMAKLVVPSVEVPKNLKGGAGG